MAELPPPPGREALRGFPARTLRASQTLFRIHRAGLGPWWFGSSGELRFDLPSPQGTCYLALHPIGAFIEVFEATQTIPLAELDARRIARTAPPANVRLANTTVRRALAFGCPLTIGASERYERTQPWARAFAAAGFDGILYRLSHDPRAQELGVALFGQEGEPPDPPVWTSEPIGPDLIGVARRRFGFRFAEHVLELAEGPWPARGAPGRRGNLPRRSP